uniref:Serine/threonine-protein kinase ATR n=1 Tax=Dermatophagoides pteronyssinus TaxID=6956 RepID=A0A6P6XLX7_DERPT|nr:uncharacterized protein LOC113789127 [Dermatophagoides pteronyssinus]
MITWTEYSINFLRNFSIISNRYNSIIRIYYIMVTDTMVDGYFCDFSTIMNEFFIEFEKKISTLKSMTMAAGDNECQSNNNNDLLDWNSTLVIDLLDRINARLANDNNIGDNRSLSTDHPFFQTTIPLSLKTLLMLSIKFHSILEIILIIKKIQAICIIVVQQQQQQQRNEAKPESKEWSSLIDCLDLSIRCFLLILCAPALNFEQIKRIVILFLNIGIDDGQDGQNDCVKEFRQILITKSFEQLAIKINESLVNLFLNYQNDIGKLMVQKLRKNFQLNFLIDCSKYFNIDMFSNELLCWIIPDLIIEWDDRITKLLDLIILQQKISDKPKIYIIRQYFSNIIEHLFFNYPNDTDFIGKIFEMTKSLSSYCQYNVFELFYKEKLADKILKRFGQNSQRTLKALSFIYQASKITNNNNDVDFETSFRQIDLNYFEMNPQKFQQILQQEFFIYFIYKINRIIIRKDYCHYQIEEKILLCESFLQTLQHLNDSFLNVYRIRIYVLIRLILNEHSDIDKIIEIGLKILQYFIEHIDQNYLQMELLSICLLVVPFVQHLPRQTGQLLMKLLCENNNNFPISILYQLTFLANDQSNNNPLKSIVDQLQKRFNEFSNNKYSSRLLIIDSNLLSSSDMDINDNCSLDTNNNTKIRPSPSSISKQSETLNERIHLIRLIKSNKFILICREIYFLTKNLQQTNEIRLQEILLQQIYQRLDLNRHLYYRICLLGAISPKFLQFDRPFTEENYDNYFDQQQQQQQPQQQQSAISGKSYSTMFDYDNRKLFHYKKRTFKILTLDLLMEQIRTAKRLAEYNSASYAMKKLFPLFTDHTSLNGRTTTLLGCTNPEFNTQNVSNGNCISTQKIENFLKNDQRLLAGVGVGGGENLKKMKLSASQEIQFIDRCDQIKRFLLNERNENLNFDHDFMDIEFRNYRQIFKHSTMNSKDLRKLSIMKMDEFFDQQIKSTMLFSEFLQSFIYMLYHSIIIPRLKSNPIQETTMESFNHINNEEFLSQIFSSSQRHSSLNCSGSNFFDLQQEFNEIKQRINQLRTPESFFIVCYHSITLNIRLSFLLLPGLFIFSLGCLNDSNQQKFAEKFHQMIVEKFLSNTAMFSGGNELGIMFTDFICSLYDILIEWIRKRRLAHSLVIGSKFLRNRTIRQLDHEYYGIKLWLKQIDPILLARLCCQSKNYSRSLKYLENFCQNSMNANANANNDGDDEMITSSTQQQRGQQQNSSSNEFIRKHFQLYVDIYYGLDDLETLQGLIRNQIDDSNNSQSSSYQRFLYQQFHQSLLNNNILEQLIYGNRLLRLMKTNDEDQQSSEFDLLTLQEKFFHSMLNIEQSSLPSWILSDNNKSNDHRTTLNQWDLPLSSSLSSTTATLNSGIDEIIQAMYQQKSPFIIDSKLSDIRQTFLIHLNSSLLTNSYTAYNRTYNQSILQLHLLYDLQQFITIIYNRLLLLDDQQQQQQNIDNLNNDNQQQQSIKQLENSINEILIEWRNRNQLIDNLQQRQQLMNVQCLLIRLFLRYEQQIGQQICCKLLKELFHFEHDSIRCSLRTGRFDRIMISLAETYHIRDELKQRQQRSTDDSSSLWKISENESVDFLLDHSQVLWNQNKKTESIELLKTELENRYHSIQRQCYLESLKNFTPMPEQDLYNLSNLFDLNLTRTQINQMSGGNSCGTFLSSLIDNENRNNIRASSRSRTNSTTNDQTIQFDDLITEENLMNFSKIQLQIAKYSEYSGRLNLHALIILYKSITISCPRWEEAHFHLAMFYRRLYRQYQNASPLLDSKTKFLFGKPNEILDLKARTIKSICDSLRFGTYKYVRLSLPILLNIWFYMGYENISLQNRLRTVQDQRTKTLNDLCKLFIERSTQWIREMFQSSMNDAIFLIELDTLIGHLLHPIETISKLIEEILKKLIADFPRHMVWLISRSLSTRIGRRSLKTKELVQGAQKLFAENNQNDGGSISTNFIVQYFGKFNQFSDCLENLAMYKEKKNLTRRSIVSNQQQQNKNEISLQLISPTLIQCMQNDQQFKFILPSNQFFLPNSMNLERLSAMKSNGNGNDDQHYFRTLFIEKFQDKAQVMTSLQHPKRLTLYCNNGMKREILVKCGDDLRKDCTMLTYLNLFNQCYRGEIPTIEPMSRIDDNEYDGERELKIWSRRKQQPLFVRTYFAVALNDSFGVIEWIPGLTSLKSLAEKQYSKTKCLEKQFQLAKNAFIKAVCPSHLNREKRVERFLQHFENFRPPILQNWFQEYYIDSYSWYQARRNFIRTTAVFSILGYILGLGDRHTDNVMFDTQTGQMIQVDFNCLFNRGEGFIVPELIPFRLTHNMISAMGTNGYEGLFRSTCEDVLLICRQYREIFSQTVQIFLYDKFLDWCNDRNELAEKSVFNVEARLFGITTRHINKLSRGNIMSVAGQIDYVLKEATDVNNLGALYYGWAAYI